MLLLARSRDLHSGTHYVLFNQLWLLELLHITPPYIKEKIWRKLN